MNTNEHSPRFLGFLALSIVVLLLVGSVATLIWLVPHRLADNREQFDMELSKTILQLIGVLVMGSLVSMAIKYTEERKKADKAVRDVRVEYLNKIWAIDETVRKARYELRGRGLTNEFGRIGVTTLGGDQIKAYDSAIGILQEVILSLSRLQEELKTFPEMFSKISALTAKEQAMKSFLEDIVKEYEILRNQPEILYFELRYLMNLTGTPRERTISDMTYKGWTKEVDSVVNWIRLDLIPLRDSTEKQ